MSELSPQEAAYLSEIVYDVKDRITVDDTVASLNNQFKNKFNFNSSDRFKGNSGGYILNFSTAIL